MFLLSLYRRQSLLFGLVRVAFITHVMVYCCNSADCVNLFCAREHRKHWEPTPRWRCGFLIGLETKTGREKASQLCAGLLGFKELAPLQNNRKKGRRNHLGVDGKTYREPHECTIQCEAKNILFVFLSLFASVCFVMFVFWVIWGVALFWGFVFWGLSGIFHRKWKPGVQTGKGLRAKQMESCLM